MKRWIFCGVIIFSVLGMTACGKTGEKETQKTAEQEEAPLRIVLNHKLYELFDAQEEPMGDAGAVSGHILSTVDRTKQPWENGQSNFGVEGDPYCLSSSEEADEVVVLVSDQWLRFERTKFETEDGLFYDYILTLNGTYPNAAGATEVTVLTNDLELTFDAVAKKLLSSVYDPNDQTDFYVLTHTR